LIHFYKRYFRYSGISDISVTMSVVV